MMILKFLSAMWATSAPAMADHLWQSTLFFVFAGLLILLLHRNQARTRYWLWLAASLKFLIPFSLLVDIGKHLARPRTAVGMQPGFAIAVEEVSRPFTRSPMHSVAPGAQATTLPATVHLLPVLLAAIWLCGVFAILWTWYVRWRKISRIVRDSARLTEGREVEALRRMECLGGIGKRMEVRVSQGSPEPGIYGIIRPVLLWPDGISKHLDDAHLDAILAHEVWHVRRRDNLAAVIHMVVEAVFWFHPAVWWLGARLVEERERACDEEVLQMGSEPQVYAESILKACEFCLGSPLTCVSGVTGADLKNRIVRIMTQHAGTKLNFRRKLLLGVAGTAAIAVPLAFGLQSGPQNQTADAANIPNLKFEVASIKQDKSGDGQHLMMRIMNRNDGRFYATNVPLRPLLRLAYGVQDSQIVGGPGWLNSERFDIEATSDSSVDDQLRKLNPAEASLAKKRMLQALFADRFHLTITRQTKELPVYALVIAKNGPKLQKSKYDSRTREMGGVGKTLIQLENKQVSFQGASMGSLSQFLAQQLGRTVVDKTGLPGSYDFALQWTPDRAQEPMGGGPGIGPPPESQPASDSSDSSGPSIFTALQEQLGLKLESQKGPVEVLSIDHVEQPSAN